MPSAGRDRSTRETMAASAPGPAGREGADGVGEGPPGSGSRGRRSLARQVAAARLWLPLAIVGIVLLFELVVLPRLPLGATPAVRIAFYGQIGPIVTFMTLNWIAQEVRARERAQGQLAATYHELQDSHDLLAGIQRVTERFAGASDLEDAVRAAAAGVREVTGAEAAAVILGEGHHELTDHEGLDDHLMEIVRERDARLRAAGGPLDARPTDLGGRWLLSAPLRLGERVDGSIHAVFREPPGTRSREGFGILAGEFASVAEAVRTRMRDLLTLFDVDRSIRAEGNLSRLLSALLERTMRRVGATRGAVYLADGGDLLKAQVVRGTDGASALRTGVGRLGRAAARGEPLLLDGLDEGVRREAEPLLNDARCLAVLPLRSDRELLGLVLLAHDEPDGIRAHQLPFLALLAGQVSLALRNARAYLHSEELAISDERTRIAREIHDGVAQSLAFAALKIDLGRRLLPQDPARAQDELVLAADTVRESIREVRRSIFALRPVDLERHGLVETLKRYVSDFSQQNGLGADVEVGPLPELDVRNEAVLFRIFQEATHNVAKHARARHMSVRLGTDERGRAFVVVSDDGVGFDVASASDRVTSAGGLGLRQMRERVESRGGAFRVDSRPGEGTTVQASVP